MSLFQQRRPKRFNYVPRHQRDENAEEDLQSQWNAVRRNSKHRGKRKISLTWLLIGLGMIIAIWFLLTHYETA